MGKASPRNLRKKGNDLQNRWLIASGSMLLALLGLVLSFTSNQRALDFLKLNGAWIGVVLVIVAVVSIIIVVRRPRSKPAAQK
jgi:uncharacterized membrane protein YfcA